MEEIILIKYIKGDLDSHQREEVDKWINESKENLKEFVVLKNLVISQSLPQTKATQEELDSIRSLLKYNAEPSSDTGNGNDNIGMFSRLKYFLPWSVAAVLLIALVVSLLWRTSESIQVQKGVLAQNSNDSIEIFTENGVKGRLVLPDGSKVILNSGSTIKYPNSFNENIREIYFSGEAYFEVKKDSLCPMLIKTPKGFSVKVLGTSFNLRAYKDDNNDGATLYSGVIELINDNSNQDRITMKPNESVVISNDKVMEESVSQQAIEDKAAWKDGYLIFNNEPMASVIKTLERWHGVEIIAEGDNILDMNVTATFNKESIIQIMELLRISGVLTYKLYDNKIFIQ